MEDVKSDELMKMKTANPISSLSGKVAGVNVTQSSGAAGAGAQIILRGGTSGAEGKDNQPLFVVDGVIFDNSSSVVGNSAFDGSMRSASTTSNRLMDINPEDIESMSVLKGPAAAALYGSRAANGVILITTKKGKEGVVEVNINSKFTASWVKEPAAKRNANMPVDIWKTNMIQRRTILVLCLMTLLILRGERSRTQLLMIT